MELRNGNEIWIFQLNSAELEERSDTSQEAKTVAGNRR